MSNETQRSVFDQPKGELRELSYLEAMKHIERLAKETGLSVDTCSKKLVLRGRRLFLREGAD